MFFYFDLLFKNTLINVFFSLIFMQLKSIFDWGLVA